MTERDDEARIHELMGETARAFRAHDVAALDRVFADDFTFTDPAGPVISSTIGWPGRMVSTRCAGARPASRRADGCR